MKTALFKILPACCTILLIVALSFHVEISLAQDTATSDTTKAVKDNSSSFNDSVQFDDMEPIFYEATEDDTAAEKPAENSSSGLALYGGIIVVLIVVLFALRKAGKKKPSKD